MKKQISDVFSSLFFTSAGFVLDQLSSDIDQSIWKLRWPDSKLTLEEEPRK